MLTRHSGRRILNLQTSLALVNSSRPTQPKVEADMPALRELFVHPALEGLPNLTNVPISGVLTKEKLAKLASRIGMREIIRWKPKNVRFAPSFCCTNAYNFQDLQPGGLWYRGGAKHVLICCCGSVGAAERRRCSCGGSKTEDFEASGDILAGTELDGVGVEYVQYHNRPVAWVKKIIPALLLRHVQSVKLKHLDTRTLWRDMPSVQQFSSESRSQLAFLDHRNKAAECPTWGNVVGFAPISTECHLHFNRVRLSKYELCAHALFLQSTKYKGPNSLRKLRGFPCL